MCDSYNFQSQFKVLNTGDTTRKVTPYGVSNGFPVQPYILYGAEFWEHPLGQIQMLRRYARKVGLHTDGKKIRATGLSPQ